MQPDILSSGYLVLRAGKPIQFLLMKHPNRWDLPKGKLDDGETLIQAAQRELWEETGIPSTNIWTDPYFSFQLEYPVDYSKKRDEPRRKRLTVFLGWLLKPQEIIVTEHSGFRWWDWSPPHVIQRQTIDSLLEHVANHMNDSPNWPK